MVNQVKVYLYKSEFFGLDQFSVIGDENEAISIAKNLLFQEIMQQKHKYQGIYILYAGGI